MRDEGVLIVGSGNLVHNLRSYAWGKEQADPLDWAVLFEQRAAELMLAANPKPLIAYQSLIPTPDHYLPLL